MSVADREIKLTNEVRDLYDFYTLNSIDTDITLFAEDFDFLRKRGKIAPHGERFWLGGIYVKKGDKKRKPRRKRPPEMF